MNSPEEPGFDEAALTSEIEMATRRVLDRVVNDERPYDPVLLNAYGEAQLKRLDDVEERARLREQSMTDKAQLETEKGVLNTALAQSEKSRLAERAEAEERQKSLEESSLTDALTGLANRRKLMDDFGNLQARRFRDTLENPNQNRRAGDQLQPENTSSIAIIDLDHFKAVNDTNGHLAGDAVLKTVAGVLREATRAEDTAARPGGDEFVVLFNNAAPEQVRARLQEIREKVALTGIPITLSVGMSEIDPQANFEEAFSQADQAVYAAKENGRDNIVVFMPVKQQ